MRILLTGNSPFCQTGYGIQPAQLALYLKQMGHDPAIFAYYGLAGSLISWNDIPIYPNPGDDYGAKWIEQIYDHFKADCLITLIDVWVLGMQSTKCKWFPWTPIDHEPMPPNVYKVLSTHAGLYKPIAMSRYGEGEMKRLGIDCFYVPHMINCEVYYPDAELRKEQREKVGWTNKFVVGQVGTNVRERKNWTASFLALSKFRRYHNDVVMYCHTNAGETRGRNLQALRENLMIKDITFFPSMTEMLLTGISDITMNNMYNSLDVYLHPSKGEGFGIPIVEAQACFPSETFVVAENIRGTHKRLYTGDIITIQTSKGVISATPEHPFWTGNNWTLAKDLTINHQLWYNKEYTIGGGNGKESKLHKGTIGEIVRTLHNNDAQGGSVKVGNDLRTSILASVSSGSPQNNRSEGGVEVSCINRSRVGLLGGSDRWRGNNLNQETEWQGRQLETDYFHIQQFPKSYGMVDKKDKLPEYLHRETQVTIGLRSGVSVSYNGHRFSSSIPEIITFTGDKAETLPFDSPMVTREVKSRSSRENQQEATRDYPNVKGFEPETIMEIRSRKVENLPVYNLATKSHVYVAKGFIVHNCGVPVIVSNNTSQPELCGGGWILTDMRPEFDEQSSWEGGTNPDEIVEYLEQAYQEKRSGKLEERKKAAREKALEYDCANVVEKYWKPTLAEIEKMITSIRQPIDRAQDYRNFLIPRTGDCNPPRVLDIGCGFKQSWKSQLEHLGEYVGVDIKGGDGVIKMDAHNLKFPDKHFGFVWCCDLLEHVENPQRVVNEAKRVANHGAIIFCTPMAAEFNIDPEHKEVKLKYGITKAGHGYLSW